MEVCFTQAALFTHTVKNVIAAAGASPVGVSELLNAVYESSEELNPFLNSCGIDIPLVDKFESQKPANPTSCFCMFLETFSLQKITFDEHNIQILIFILLIFLLFFLYS